MFSYSSKIQLYFRISINWIILLIKFFQSLNVDTMYFLNLHFCGVFCFDDRYRFSNWKKAQEKLSEWNIILKFYHNKSQLQWCFIWWLYLCDKSIKVSTNEKDIKTKCLITFTIDSIMTSIVKRVKQSNDIDIYFLNIY